MTQQTTTTAPARIRTLADLKRANRAAGHHFFSRGAMEFFNSRIDSKLYRVDDWSGYFVTSEQREPAYVDAHGVRRPEFDTPREWRVRRYSYALAADGSITGTIDTAADGAPSAEPAHDYAAVLAARERDAATTAAERMAAAVAELVAEGYPPALAAQIVRGRG